MDSPGAVFDEHQYVDAFEQDRVDVEEIGGGHGVGLGGVELLPGRSAAAWGGVDAGVVRDLPDGGPGHRSPEATCIGLGRLG